MQVSTVIIQGSSRSAGNTHKVVECISNLFPANIIDLNDYDISYFDYHHANKNDDFIPLMKSIVDQYDTIIFASPVYWYSMSAQMKTFFDRISDLLKIEKPLGRMLRGKRMATISCSGHDDVPDAFYEPYRLSADYLGMTYLGEMHGYVENDEIPIEVQTRLANFASKISKK